MISMLLSVSTNYRQTTIMDFCHSPKLCNYRLLPLNRAYMPLFLLFVPG
jgi:hypothetical protein